MPTAQGRAVGTQGLAELCGEHEGLRQLWARARQPPQAPKPSSCITGVSGPEQKSRGRPTAPWSSALVSQLLKNFILFWVSLGAGPKHWAAWEGSTARTWGACPRGMAVGMRWWSLEKKALRGQRPKVHGSQWAPTTPLHKCGQQGDGCPGQTAPCNRQRAGWQGFPGRLGRPRSWRRVPQQGLRPGLRSSAQT